MINSHVTNSSLGVGSLSEHGITARYNGINMHQTRDYIKLNCETYLKQVLKLTVVINRALARVIVLIKFP